MIYGKQIFFCNSCGKRCWDYLPNVVGREWKCCSMDCVRKINETYTKSIMGESCEDPENEFRRALEKANHVIKNLDKYVKPTRLIREDGRAYEAEPRHLNTHDWDSKYVCTKCHQQFKTCDVICRKHV